MIKGLCVETICELEQIALNCSRSKFSEFDLWSNVDGNQEVSLFAIVEADCRGYIGGSWISQSAARDE